MSTIFLTGGTGFIGSHFINKVSTTDHVVYALRRPTSIPRIPLMNEPIWVDGSLTDDFRTVLSACDVVVHLAAHSANPPYDSLENCLFWNLSASLALFKQAYDVGIKKFLVAGSCFEYGMSSDRYDVIPTTASLEPTMSYPTSKAAASTAFYGWAAEHHVQLTLLRVFQVFGEGESENRLWPSLRRAALAGQDFEMTLGDQVRDFIPVEDVVDAFISELTFQNAAPGIPLIKNVGTGIPQTVRAFSECWWRKWNATGQLKFGAIPYRQNEVMRFVPEIGGGVNGK